MNLSKLILGALLALACATFASAQGNYTQFDYPGATGTFPSTVDTAGDVVGSWTDSNYNYHGFLFSNGTYTPIDYPDAQNTTVGGINDKGQIVGYSFPATNPRNYTGFLYNVQTQSFTTLADSAVTSILPSSINNSGLISGLAYTTESYVFALLGSTYRLIAPPTALQGGTFWVAGVTDSGAIVVTGETTSGTYVAYSYSNGAYSPIQLPQRTQLQLFGVNPEGNAYVGAYQVSISVTAGYLSHGDSFISLQFPGSEDTNGEGINRTGEVVGNFTVDSVVHGFIWTLTAPDKEK